jgi:hypothetical protein
MEEMPAVSRRARLRACLGGNGLLMTGVLIGFLLGKLF